jgi:hypothetical protein
MKELFYIFKRKKIKGFLIFIEIGSQSQQEIY